MTFEDIVQQMVIETGIELTDLYQPDEITDAGFSFNKGDHRYHVQIAPYMDDPLILFDELPDGCFKEINSFKTQAELTAAIKEL